MRKKLLSLALLLLLLPGLCLAQADQTLLRQVFGQSVFSLEYGQADPLLRRFQGPLKIHAYGQMTEADRAFLPAFLQLLQDGVVGLPPISLVFSQEEANITYAYVPLKDMGQHTDFYTEGNWGYVTFFWNSKQEMTGLQIAIASDVTNQEERNHLVMEELVNGLGLLNDVDQPKDSIITQDWTTIQELSALDWQLLNTLYDQRLKPGMTRKQAFRALGWD